MSTNLILPKQTARIDVFFATIEIYYNNKTKDGWLSNTIYKKLIKEKIKNLGNNDAYLVKQSELTRYFGLVYYDYSVKPSRAKITERGKRFYLAYVSGNNEMMQNIIMESIFNDSFGRNNTAIKNSDSDIDVPKLFIKSIFDCQGISNNQFKKILFLVHDKKINYLCAIKEVISDCQEIELPESVINKYDDIKSNQFLNNFGLVYSENGYFFLESNLLKKYKDKIKNLSIYNKVPDTQFSLETELNINASELEKKQIIEKSLPYDISSKAFYKQNNRTPKKMTNAAGYSKYSTNPRISKTALETSKYTCMLGGFEHKTVISKKGNPIMEGHHLIPMSAQNDFEINLDRLENIVCLCPNCHSAIHLANHNDQKEKLKTIYDLMSNKLHDAGIDISFEDLLVKYYD